MRELVSPPPLRHFIVLVRLSVVRAITRCRMLDQVAASRRRRTLATSLPSAGAALVCGLGLVAAGVAAAPSAQPVVSDARADQLLVVDCLLPGQVRSLGQRSTYLSARRPVRLPARDCQIRGGEYVAYDRADLASALSAWRPMADQGEVHAQVVVGEIFERGLGVAPDYAAAEQWYRRAAEAGDRRAQVNLGYLLERGLGLPADPAAALEWYRRAAGRDVPIVLDPGPVAPAPVMPEDRAELERLTEELRQLDTALAGLRADLESSQQALAASESRARAAEAAAEEAALRTSQPAASADQIAALQHELTLRTREAEAIGTALAAARREQDEQRRALVERGAEAREAQAALAVERARLADAAARLAGRDAELATQRAEAGRLAAELEVAAKIAADRQREIDHLARSAAEGLMAGPQLTLIEPALAQTRDIVPVVSAAGPQRQIVGRVIAPAGIVALAVNDVPVVASDLGVFSTTVSVTSEVPVSIVAVDRQGKRDELRFLLRSAARPPVPAGQARAPDGRDPAAGIDFGAYHALIIGNDDYRYLPDLASPVNDATDLARLLERRYRFRTTVLLNADRYQILSALNSLRETLTPRDNLLVYFAGHGELDEVNQRGHWLPVDAERDSTANWIPTTAITDILNIIRAKQVLLVVDSCYAGTLTRSSVGRLGTGMTNEERTHWLRTMASKRSRTVLTSGGVAPVMDAGGGRHSVFAKALIEVLEANGDTLDGQRLHREVAARVAYAAASLRFDQVPEYAPIRHAGHEAGEFFLVPGS